METHMVQVKWSPGHTGIEGNEAADKLADSGALVDAWDAGFAARPTASGIGTIMRTLRTQARMDWWNSRSSKLSKWYKTFNLSYSVKKLLELDLPITTLHRYIAVRTSHGDFDWYHRKFQHNDAKTTCLCGKNKSPEHLVLCPKTQRRFMIWPSKPDLPPSNKREAAAYLHALLQTPKNFAKFLEITKFYTDICTR